eukprot:GHVP01040999.1.p1 GENE.GHVP01040999.1~~GHVP01040999.1.p1  ORF type:complete len:139 (-),score=24.07 GHVP01040999.1:127-543(-)
MIENFAQFATASTAFAVIPNFSEDFEANMNAGPQEAVPHVGQEKKTNLDEESSLSSSSQVTVVKVATNNLKATQSAPASVEGGIWPDPLPEADYPTGFLCLKPRKSRYGCCCWRGSDEGISLGGTATCPKGEHRFSKN